MGWVQQVQGALGRSKVIVLALLVAVIFFTAGFVELAVTRRQMEARYQQALERYERTARQNTLLQIQLERAQRDELVPWLAWELFGRLPKGAGGIQTEPVAPAATEENQPAQPEQPTWRAWLKELGLN